MGCGSEPHEAPNETRKTTTSARVSSVNTPPMIEQSSASERSRAVNGLQPSVTFLEKAKLDGASDGPRRGQSPIQEDVLC